MIKSIITILYQGFDGVNSWHEIESMYEKSTAIQESEFIAENGFGIDTGRVYIKIPSHRIVHVEVREK